MLIAIGQTYVYSILICLAYFSAQFSSHLAIHGVPYGLVGAVFGPCNILKSDNARLRIKKTQSLAFLG